MIICVHSEAQHNMTKCVEFYEKLEKDGNFCGISARYFKEAMEYWNEYRQVAERNGGDKSPLTEREWFNQQREANKAVKQHKEEVSSVRNDKGQLIGRSEVLPKSTEEDPFKGFSGRGALPLTSANKIDPYMTLYIKTLTLYGELRKTNTIKDIVDAWEDILHRKLSKADIPEVIKACKMSQYELDAEVEEDECPTCANAKENLLVAMGVLDHYGIPPDLGDKVQKWIEEKYGK